METFSINGVDHLERLIRLENLEDGCRYRLPDSDVYAIAHEYGQIHFHHWRGPHSNVWMSQYGMWETAVVSGATQQAMIELQFALGHPVVHQSEGLGMVAVPGMTCNLYFEPYAANKVLLKKGSRMITFDIHLTVAELQALCLHLPGLEPFVQKVLKGEFARLSPEPLPITSEQAHLLQSMLQAPARPHLQYRIFEPQLDALVLSAIAHLLQQKVTPMKVTATDREAIHAIRDTLLANLDERRTIQQLAEDHYINTHKLKTLFKQEFGVSVLQFSLRERMEKASVLLRSTDCSIQDVAFQVGYQMPSSFIEKFREYFLLSPLQYRKQHSRNG